MNITIIVILLFTTMPATATRLITLIMAMIWVMDVPNDQRLILTNVVSFSENENIIELKFLDNKF